MMWVDSFHFVCWLYSCVMNVTPFRAALRHTLAVGLGYIPLGVAFGLYAISQGFHWWMATLTALIIYAGSMEFLAVGLIMTGAPLTHAAFTTLFVNFRHVFYGLSYPLRQIRSRLARLYSIHALTDEAYALLSSPRCQNFPGARVFWTGLLCQIYWVTGVTAGALVGSTLPWDLSWMGFTLTALFVVLAIDVLADAMRPGTLLLIALAAVAAGSFVSRESMMIVAMCGYGVVITLFSRRLV